MDTLYGEWTQCKNCIYFDDCTTKESDDGCYFGNNDEVGGRGAEMPETIDE